METSREPRALQTILPRRPVVNARQTAIDQLRAFVGGNQHNVRRPHRRRSLNHARVDHLPLVPRDRILPQNCHIRVKKQAPSAITVPGLFDHIPGDEPLEVDEEDDLGQVQPPSASGELAEVMQQLQNQRLSLYVKIVLNLGFFNEHVHN